MEDKGKDTAERNDKLAIKLDKIVEAWKPGEGSGYKATYLKDLIAELDLSKAQKRQIYEMAESSAIETILVNKLKMPRKDAREAAEFLATVKDPNVGKLFETALIDEYVKNKESNVTMKANFGTLVADAMSGTSVISRLNNLSYDTLDGRNEKMTEKERDALKSNKKKIMTDDGFMLKTLREVKKQYPDAVTDTLKEMYDRSGLAAPKDDGAAKSGSVRADGFYEASASELMNMVAKGPTGQAQYLEGAPRTQVDNSGVNKGRFT
jgi:hypothetical protein